MSGFGYLVFSPHPWADDMVDDFREMDARFLLKNFLISHRTKKAHQSQTPLLKLNSVRSFSLVLIT